MPLLPTASGRPAEQPQTARRQARRLLLGLLALCAAEAAWDSQSALCTWRRGRSNQTSKNAEPVAAGQQGNPPAAHTASNADEAAVLGGAASRAAAPASSSISQTAAGADHTARPAAPFAWEERPGGQYPPAELPPPTVDAASNHSCAQVGRSEGAPGWALDVLRACRVMQLLSPSVHAAQPVKPCFPPQPASTLPSGAGNPQSCPPLTHPRPNAPRRDVAPLARLRCRPAAGPQCTGKLSFGGDAQLNQRFRAGGCESGNSCACATCVACTQRHCAGRRPLPHVLQEAVCSAGPKHYRALQRACSAPQDAAAGWAGTLAQGSAAAAAANASAVMGQQYLFSMYVHAPPSFPGKLGRV